MSSFIHPTAVIGPNVTIEDAVYIGPLCVIGFPAEWRGHEDEDRGVLICKGSRLTGLVTVDAGVEGPTIIGPNCYIMKAVHLGHDAVIGKDVTISCKAIVGGHTVIKDEANVGLGAIIHQRQTIAEGCMLGMGAIITKKLITKPFCIYIGNPARYLGPNERHPRYPIYTINMKDTL